MMAYETVIGLEIHVQLDTKSKAFCADKVSFGAAPNTLVSAISLGHPGTLPRLNERQLEYAVRLGLALGSEINRETSFDRKNYFYADLPKGYQITQDNAPICIGGKIPIQIGEDYKWIQIHHVHMEEDAGKSIHDRSELHSLIDLNRAGTPLLEIVTEPDLRSAQEVDALMTAMRQLVRYIGISDGNMQEGSMRCDCNISVRPLGADYYNNRCEIKNLNSMRYARNAIKYEVERQIKIMEAGGVVSQQTLSFDPATGVTTPIRGKEDAHDYRYFPEPDLPLIQLDQDYIQNIKTALPALPWEVKERLQSSYALSHYDADLISEEKQVANFFFDLCEQIDSYKAVANLMINKVLPWCKDQQQSIDQFPIGKPHLAAFIQLITSNKISNSIAYQELWPALLEQASEEPLALAQQMNLMQSDDQEELRAWIATVLANHPKEVAAYKSGKKQLIGFFMGAVMKVSKGKAAPKQTNALLREMLAY